MDYKDLRCEDERLVILRALQMDAGAYTANESILHDILGAFGHKVSRDRVKTQLAWLQEQGLVKLQDAYGCLIATLTCRGIEVATGVVTTPGVKRPRPRD